ncbi:MAG TPA: Crp/Fnr family transcriptional regulator [Xenococcaceae cyanobacterium]
MVLSIQPPSDSNSSSKEFYRSANQLLDFLSTTSRQNLLRHSQRILLPAKTSLYQPDEPIKTVYFPIRGIVSLVNIDAKGLMAEAITVSHEGMVGITAFLGGDFFPGYAIVQTDCVAISLAADLLQQEFAMGGELQRILLLYTQALLAQVTQNVFCSCHHTLEQRLARWLLAFGDRLNQKELLLTQETLAELLGVKRSSLSTVASELRQKNLIDYSRGRISLQNLPALRNIACECDRYISAEYSRLFSL